ncbi:MAG: hypothetical protein V1663_05145 [archaeon]
MSLLLHVTVLLKVLQKLKISPPKIKPVNKDTRMLKPNKNIAQEITITATKKLKKVIQRLLVTPFAKDAKSILKAPSYNKNNKAKVVKIGAKDSIVEGCT